MVKNILRLVSSSTIIRTQIAKQHIKSFLFALAVLNFASAGLTQAAPRNPIVFVTQVPQPLHFAAIGSTFANHLGTSQAAPRGGDLYIRYPDGTLKNITRSAGFGNDGFQGASSIAVRDPAVSWDGEKVIFSMIIGSPMKFGSQPYRWQLYEASNLGKNQAPVITKVAHQPEAYHNIMPTYASDDSIIFVSDRPYNGNPALYPQLDEYEATPTNSGIWRLSPTSGKLQVLDSSPSGDFSPFVDSYGRILFTRWDHMQQDQMADESQFGAFNYSSESSSAVALPSTKEIFPEPRSANRQVDPNLHLHNFNLFLPWQIGQDGYGLETINHIGRHDLLDFMFKTFINDPDLKEFSGLLRPSANRISVQNLMNLIEDPLARGRYYAVNASEFRTHGAGQIVRFSAPPDLNPDEIVLQEITHRDTSSTLFGSAGTDSGLYKNPLPLSSGDILVVHTPETRDDDNIGSRVNPVPLYRLRIKSLVPSGTVFSAGPALTDGIIKSVSYWDPDYLINYSGELWELQPAELVARERPSPHTSVVPGIETNVFAEEGVDLAEFERELKIRGLALVVSRNVTTRDRADKQQPYNLRVPGGVQTIASSGKVYDVASMQMILGQQIRAYTKFSAGRRFIGTPMVHPNVPPLQSPGRVEGSTMISSDGSIAAVVPARKPLSWQLLAPDGTPVVRERFWVTFAAGEVRVCTSCHGINKADQVGNPAPQNAPAALRTLLRDWKKNGFGNIAPIDLDDFASEFPGEPAAQGVSPKFSMNLRGAKARDQGRSKALSKTLRSSAKGFLLVKGVNTSAAFKNLALDFQVAGKSCAQAPLNVQTDEEGSLTLSTKLPRISSTQKIKVNLSYSGGVIASTNSRVVAVSESAPRTKKAKARSKERNRERLCKALSRFN